MPCIQMTYTCRDVETALKEQGTDTRLLIMIRITHLFFLFDYIHPYFIGSINKPMKVINQSFHGDPSFLDCQLMEILSLPAIVQKES